MIGRRHRRPPIVVAIALGATLACSRQDSTPRPPSVVASSAGPFLADSPPGVLAMLSAAPALDTSMIVSDADFAAVLLGRRARCMLPDLIRRLNAPHASRLAFRLRARLTEAEEHEDLWLRVQSVTPDTLISATLLESPHVVRRFANGSPVAIGPDAVVDWYVADGTSIIERASDRATMASAASLVAAGGVDMSRRPFDGDPVLSMQLRVEPARADGAAPRWLADRCR